MFFFVGEAPDRLATRLYNLLQERPVGLEPTCCLSRIQVSTN